MNRKRAVALAGVFVVLAVLFYLQFRTWKEFHWERFWAETRHAHKLPILAGVALIYAVYPLRAVRWRIFLGPRRKTRFADVLVPQYIGFTGLALLGRPGELSRPYLIARRTGVSMASQMAVWIVERIFDTAAVALILAALLFSGALDAIPFFHDSPQRILALRRGGYVLFAFLAGLVALAFAIWRKEEGAAAWVRRRFHRIAPHLADRAAEKVRAFSQGLHTLHSWGSFFAVSALSLVIWAAIACSYLAVLHAYPELKGFDFGHVALLLVASMVGSALQLPAVGGGSQLAVISVLHRVFDVREELAVSCGILLWLVTFMSVIPAGLALARRQHVSLRRLSEESQQETNND